MMTSVAAFAADAECQYFDGEGKASKLDASKVPDGASVESKSVNMLPGD